MIVADPRSSIVARVTLALAAIAVLVFGAAGTALYWTLERELMRVEFDEVQGKVEQVQQMLAESPAGIDDDFRRRLDGVLAGHGNLLVAIRSRDGHLLFANSDDPLLAVNAATPSMFTLQNGSATAGCKVEIREPGPAEGAQVTVALATSMRGNVLRMYRSTVVWICVAGFAATLLLAAWATRRGFRPVRALAARAARITPESLSLRLPEVGEDQELQALAGSFNQALDRLQQAYTRLEGFNADVAHELRTPLATLISGIEVTLAQPRGRDELEQLHFSNLEVLERLRAIVNDMLFLARADNGEQAADRQEVSLADEAGKVVEFYDGLLQQAGVQVALQGDARVRCNPGLVRRALSNLLSNALKYSGSAAPQAIAIRIDDGAASATVVVSNRGPTIPAENLPRIFDRFYRGEAARGRSESHGLGLAIVRAVATMHGGSATAWSQDGVTEVGFRLAK